MFHLNTLRLPAILYLSLSVETGLRCGMEALVQADRTLPCVCIQLLLYVMFAACHVVKPSRRRRNSTGLLKRNCLCSCTVFKQCVYLLSGKLITSRMHSSVGPSQVDFYCHHIHIPRENASAPSRCLAETLLEKKKQHHFTLEYIIHNCDT